jgi:AraC family transcriptional regulator of adaptative response/methylated-DNA-[protein]-cysteine methyltransferase
MRAPKIRTEVRAKIKNWSQDTDSKVPLAREKMVSMNTNAATLDQQLAPQVQTEIDFDYAWQQLLARNHNASFVYAVTTTGVFCCPGCSSRLPLRSNTRFFSTADEARAKGFRACLRCRPEEPSAVASMCAYIEHLAGSADAHGGTGRPVRLAELGKLVGISPFTAQRTFKQVMGISPVQYQRALRANNLREQLRRKSSSGAESTVTTAIYEAGYGSSSRAYEQTPLGMTPAKFQAGGRGETIRFAAAACGASAIANGIEGWIIIASTERGICWVALGDSPQELEAGLRTQFPAAELAADPQLQTTVASVLDTICGNAASNSLPLDLRGTAFQLRVWKALQEIPPGETRSYSQLAAEMGIPAATRAVARACATNRVAVLVPCHRVVGASGSLTGYRWGVERKRQLLAAEVAKSNNPSTR